MPVDDVGAVQMLKGQHHNTGVEGRGVLRQPIRRIRVRVRVGVRVRVRVRARRRRKG